MIRGGKYINPDTGKFISKAVYDDMIRRKSVRTPTQNQNVNTNALEVNSPELNRNRNLIIQETQAEEGIKGFHIF